MYVGSHYSYTDDNILFGSRVHRDPKKSHQIASLQNPYQTDSNIFCRNRFPKDVYRNLEDTFHEKRREEKRRQHNRSRTSASHWELRLSWFSDVDTSFFVRRMRLELTRSCDHYPLKVACIPISPPAHCGIRLR